MSLRYTYRSATLTVDNDDVHAHVPATTDGLTDLVMLAARVCERWKLPEFDADGR